MIVTPLKDKVLVAQNKRETTTSAGIIVENGFGDTASATVLAIGPDVTDVVVGDKIYLDWAKCSPVKVDGHDRAMVAQEFIIAVIED
jgi:co-chaperonin GroES (HSP10)